MSFNEKVQHAIKEVNSLNESINHIKSYPIVGNFIIYSITSLTIFFIASESLLSINSLILSFILGIFYYFFIVMLFMSFNFIFKKKFIKELYLRQDDLILPFFYNKKQKKEIIEKYNNLDKNIKFLLIQTSKMYKEIKTHLFLETFLLHYLVNNNIFNEYKDILEFVSETEYDIDKKIFFKHILDKLVIENESFYKDYKDEIVDYVYNSQLKYKKVLLSTIKEHIKNNSDIDTLYREVSNIKIKKEESKNIYINVL